MHLDLSCALFRADMKRSLIKKIDGRGRGRSRGDPLATVVIGGIVSSTLLTLVVLPGQPGALTGNLDLPPGRGDLLY
jgi:hypothetical protein